MATNRKFAAGDALSVVATAPATPSSGDPILVGQLPGVALTDERADGTVSAQFNGVFELPVKGADGAGNAAIAAGDIVYYDGGEINADDTNGVRFGYALEAVLSGATTTIDVKVGY